MINQRRGILEEFKLKNDSDYLGENITMKDYRSFHQVWPSG